MSINFILETTRIFHNDKYTQNDLDVTYHFLTSVDNQELIDYYNTCSVISYNNDLEMYLEILGVVMKIFEDKEEYEKCHLLKMKKEESLKIINE